jgi:thiaminase/transcriptional activator TenA
MIDNAVTQRIGDLSTSPRTSVLQNRFSMATQLEVGFWKMGLKGL